MDINLHAPEIGQVANLPEVDDACHEAADAVAQEARERAPKKTGQSAESIHAEPVDDPSNPGVYRVSWEPWAYWMRFHELGSEHEPARPFLRPAADAPANRNN